MASTAKLITITLRLQDEMSKELDKAGNSLKKMESSFTSLGTKMTAAFTVPIVAAGAAAVKTSMDFDKALRNIQTIGGQTDEQLKELGQTFKDMSMDMSLTIDSAQNLNEAFYQIQSSGFAGEDAMLVLEASTKAATAGLTTTATAAEATTAVLNAYGLSAEHAAAVNDIMFETVNRGVVTYEQLSGSIGTVIGLAAQLGVEFDEIGAAMATMTKQGISHDEAMTNLNGIFTAMIKPTDAMSKAINDLGYSSGSAMLETLGLGGTMQALEKYTGGSAEEMSALFGDVRALRGAMALTGSGAQMFADDLLAIGDASGATQKAFDIQMKSFAAAWANFQNTVGVALMEIGDILLPFLANLLTNYITPLVQWFISLNDATQGWIIGILAVIAAIGPLLLIFGQIAGAISAIATIMPMVSGAFAAFMALGAPLIALIALVIAGIVLLAANWEQLGTTLTQVGTIVDQKMGGIFSKARDTAGQVAQLVGHAWQEMASKAGTALSQLGQIVMAALNKLVQSAGRIGLDIMKGMLKGILSGAIELIAAVLNISQQIQNAIKKSLGIASPSKVMMELGEQTAQGFYEGLAGGGAGSFGVETPSMSGGRNLGTSLATTGAGGGMGGGNQNFYITVAKGTPDEQVREIMQKIAKESRKKGATGK